MMLHHEECVMGHEKGGRLIAYGTQLGRDMVGV